MSLEEQLAFLTNFILGLLCERVSDGLLYLNSLPGI